MRMEISFHHAVACWCDNQAQRDEKHQVGGYTCINAHVCKTQKEKKICFSMYQGEFVWSSNSETEILTDAHLSDHPSG